MRMSGGNLLGEWNRKDDQIAMVNRIFEMRMINMFITEEALESDAIRRGEQDKNQFARNGRLNMEREWMWRQSELY